MNKKYKVIREFPFAKVDDVWETDEQNDYLMTSNFASKYVFGDELEQMVKDGWLEEVENNRDYCEHSTIKNIKEFNMDGWVIDIGYCPKCKRLVWLDHASDVWNLVPKLRDVEEEQEANSSDNVDDLLYKTVPNWMRHHRLDKSLKNESTMNFEYPEDTRTNSEKLDEVLERLDDIARRLKDIEQEVWIAQVR